MWSQLLTVFSVNPSFPRVFLLCELSTTYCITPRRCSSWTFFHFSMQRMPNPPWCLLLCFRLSSGKRLSFFRVFTNLGRSYPIVLHSIRCRFILEKLGDRSRNILWTRDSNDEGSSAAHAPRDVPKLASIGHLAQRWKPAFRWLGVSREIFKYFSSSIFEL